MFPSSLRCLHLLTLSILLATAVGDVSTKVVAVTSTKTVHVTATDYHGACDNFVGACVVYGTAGTAPYTTTIYKYNRPSSSSTSTYTSTTTILATTTASNSGDCSGFSGACVVYATNSGRPATSTVYNVGGSGNHAGAGNSQGYIGPKEASGDGEIGGAAVQWILSWEAILSLAVVVTMFAMSI